MSLEETLKETLDTVEQGIDECSDAIRTYTRIIAVVKENFDDEAEIGRQVKNICVQDVQK